ncbi:DUF262 domain-containing protein [Enterococcus sp. RIT-PI-f]|uniref:DUF262 domain-containing protein n=1 Tax=Enterococcus sp. RIT-PI-f TaxID=1690244 RepID=UPI0006B94FA4|nr:DUF262 domain-containing protein [Enterococcus sp. RIT-PI-f]
MIYGKIENGEVIEITDLEQENFIAIQAESIDDAIDYFNEQGIVCDESIIEEIENIFLINQEEKILNIYDIKVSTENRSFNELADMFQEGEIEIPDMQRNFVWSTSKCSKLIESILIGLPIPPLFFMDKGNNRYEVIDGLQRLTAISNFILGNNWGNITNSVHRNRPAKLSTNVDESIVGKKFVDLNLEQQKKLKRSTITVIDFRQIGQQDDKAKYLIFERINTGSELLNPMQIRKALAYGDFMSSLYEAANASSTLKSIFGKQYLNKDRHVEFLLGVYVTYKVLKDQYELTNQYQKYILNDFCENEKDSEIELEFVEEFDTQLGNMLSVFEDNEIFKKVDSNGNYHGNRNTNISEVFLATAIVHKTNINENIVDRYKHEIHTKIDKFNVNKMNNGLLDQRYEVCKRILGIDDE